ncbi:hypothetical protein GN956_G19182 [Arapaima gigas]
MKTPFTTLPPHSSATAAPMTPQTQLFYGFGYCYLLASALLASQAQGLQCYGCNILQGQRYVDVGCSNPEIITCSHAHKGFKHRFCIRTESTALGILLTSGCATARHCHQQELPGVRIHCCNSDLCNSASSWQVALWHYICTLTSLLLLWWCV